MTGIANSQVLLHDGESDSVIDDTCEIHPDWNAAVCKGDIGRLNLSDAREELPRAADFESPTARLALLASSGGGAAARTSWFKDGKDVWVKLVAAPPVNEIIRPTDLQASITVSR